MSVLNNLKPERVFYFFEEISKIPRGSGNEDQISKYCYNFGKEKGLECYLDKYYNVLIKKPGSAGKESDSPLILQGHTDMVCEKNSDSNHDFLKDPIKIVIDGDNIKADGTTLGADNGIAVAAMLAILDDSSLIHPPIECVFTAEEEQGLKGATNFDYGKLNGKRMINLDSEEYGYAYVSCAGGMRSDIELNINWIDTAFKNPETYSIKLRGLKGGHSGMDINLGRGNANKLIGRLLDYLFGKIDFEICNISGGLQDNAIPRESQTFINIKGGEDSKLSKLVSDFEKIIISEYRIPESGISLEISKENNINKVFCKETRMKVIAIIMSIPNGILNMSFDISGLVETSNNLGIIATTENSIIFSSAGRSCVETRKDYLENAIRNIAILADAKFVVRNKYPGWEYNPNSKLRDIAKDAFKDLTDADLRIEAIHAGLECGIFKSNLPDLDIISIGPDMWNVHTPDERLSISSVEKFYEFVLKLLEKL